MRSIGAGVAGLVLSLSACSSPPPVEPAAGDARVAALDALERETGAPWKVRWHRDLATPALLEGRTPPLLGPSRAGVEAGARRFLSQHRVLYGMDSGRDQLVVDLIDRDELGMVHVRMQQQEQGLPVWGHGLRLHFAADGALVRIEGRFAPLPPLSHIAPTVTAVEAVAAALVVMPAGATAGAAHLGVHMARGDPGAVAARLAWRVDVTALDAAAPARTAVFIGATSGEPYARDELLDSLRGSGVGVFGDVKQLEVSGRATRFVLEDASAGRPVQAIHSARYGTLLPGELVSSDQPDRWDDVVDGRGAAVDAAVYIRGAQDYFERVHGRHGARDRGDGMRATVHFGHRFAGAFWNGEQLVFGDGDGPRLLPLAGALDVVAHEFTHAVTESAADLGHAGEPGALGEAVADIFACFVERGVRGSSANWSIGEAVFRGAALGTTPGLRDLADPHRSGHPAHLDERRQSIEDRGGIHATATIAGHAAYLMTVGGTNSISGIHVEGIGVSLAERIWYRALTRYLGPSSDFRDAADATLTAARDLSGGDTAAARSVARAWQAVGVLPPL